MSTAGFDPTWAVETNGERTAGHDRLQALVGDCAVERENYLAGPRPDEPARGSGLVAHKGDPHSGTDDVISMSGVFTHAGGLYPDEMFGASIAQRTEIRIDSPDRHVIDIFFAAPGGDEVLADHGVYTRTPSPSQ